MTYKAKGRNRGFTMVELLIAIIIIGVLVTIIVPVLSNRAADARLTAAKADMEAIANAESQVALDTGYVVRLHVLDDTGAFADGKGSGDPLDVTDTILDEKFNSAAGSGAGNPDQIFLDAKTGELMPPNLFVRLEGGTEKFGWRGPYVNFQRKLTPPNPFVAPAAGLGWTYGTPLDPWGNPYFLLMPGQQLNSGGTVGRWLNEITGALDTQFAYGGSTAPANHFDRLTIYSMGPDGIPGSGTNNVIGLGDDLLRAF